jgi:hypothetical protein
MPDFVLTLAIGKLPDTDPSLGRTFRVCFQ